MPSSLHLKCNPKQGPNSLPCDGRRHLEEPWERNVGRNTDWSPTLIGRNAIQLTYIMTANRQCHQLPY